MSWVHVARSEVGALTAVVKQPAAPHPSCGGLPETFQRSGLSTHSHLRARVQRYVGHMEAQRTREEEWEREKMGVGWAPMESSVSVKRSMHFSKHCLTILMRTSGGRHVSMPSEQRTSRGHATPLAVQSHPRTSCDCCQRSGVRCAAANNPRGWYPVRAPVDKHITPGETVK